MVHYLTLNSEVIEVIHVRFAVGNVLSKHSAVTLVQPARNIFEAIKTMRSSDFKWARVIWILVRLQYHYWVVVYIASVERSPSLHHEPCRKVERMPLTKRA